MKPFDADREFSDDPAGRPGGGSGATARDRDEQAALWAARSAGVELSAADAAELGFWLAADPANGRALEKYRRLSGQLDRVLPALVARGAVASPRAPVPARLRSIAQWWPLAAFIAVAALATVWMVQFGRPTETVRTAAAQRRSITLSDGSRVELNARTSLVVESIGRERRVRLAGGEAYFVVAKDRARPFVVETPAGSVRVTGTIFDVRSETPADLEVTVVEGSVQVRLESKNPSVLLGPGDRFTCDPATASVTRLSTAAVEDALAWRSGYVVFDGTPLDRALARFAWYHGCRIETAPEVASLRVGGRFSLDDLDASLTALEDTLPIRVIRGPDEILVNRAPSR